MIGPNEIEETLISLQKFCENDFEKSKQILKDSVMVPEVQVLKRLGDCSRWQRIATSVR